MKTIDIGCKYRVKAQWDEKGRLKIISIEKYDSEMFNDIIPELRRISQISDLIIAIPKKEISKKEKKEIVKILKRNRKALLTFDDFVKEKNEEVDAYVYLEG